MEYIVKILLNSLFGKWGQKFFNLDNWVHESTLEFKDMDGRTYERKGEFIRVVDLEIEPTNFCIPIWACYVTAYGRIKLHKTFKTIHDAGKKCYYGDTDSCFTNMTFKNSSKLGDLKLEMPIKEAIFVRPKFYAFKSNLNKDYIKIKGLHVLKNKPENKDNFGIYLNFIKFQDFLLNPKTKYNKFTKFKEALRRNLIPNQTLLITKELNLEDVKRDWNNKLFSQDLNLEESKPIYWNYKDHSI